MNSAEYEWDRRWEVFGSQDGRPDLSLPIATSQIPRNGCYALLGDAGLGKSTEVKRLEADRDAGAFRRVFLGHLTSEEGLHRRVFSQEWFLDWLDSDRDLELVLDGLDEGCIGFPNLPSTLNVELEELGSARARLFLKVVCRTSEFPPSLRARLHSLWGRDYHELRLLPLSVADIALAMKRIWPGKTHDEIEQTLREQPDILLMSRHPLTLKAMTERGSVDGSRSEMFRFLCEALLDELRDSRKDEIARGRSASIPRRRIVAEKLAAVCLFTGSGLISDGEGSEGASSISKIVEKDRGDGDTVRALEVREVLSTSLFTTAEERPSNGYKQLWAFALQPYVEFLTAEFLRRRSVEAGQLEMLLFSKSEDGVVRVRPERRELASWLSSDRRVLAALTEVDPLLLVESEMGTLGADERRGIVERLISNPPGLKDFGRLFANKERLGGLTFEAVDEVLRHGLESGTDSGKQVAAIIAGAQKSAALVPVLEEILTSKVGSAALRESAARALAEIDTADSREALAKLIESLQSNAGEQEILGIAAGALFPRELSSERLFDMLSPPIKANYFGAYRMFVEYSLPERLSANDVIVGLDWLIHNEEKRHDIGFPSELELAILRLAWTRVDEGDVVQRLVRLTSTHHLFLRELPGGARVEEQDEPARRRFAIAFASSQERWQTRSELGAVLGPDDLNWLVPWLDELLAGGKPEPYSVCLEIVADIYLSGDVDIEEARKSHPSLEEVLLERAKPRPPSRHETEWAERAARQRARSEEKVRLYAERLEELAVALKGGDLEAYWRLSMMAAHDPSRFSAVEFESRPEHLPGWREYFDEELRALMREHALNYLVEFEPGNEWVGSGTLNRPAMAGYRALTLLASEERLNEVEASVWRRWMPAIIAAHLPSYPFREWPRPVLLKGAFESSGEAWKPVVDKMVAARRKDSDLDLLLADLEQVLDQNVAEYFLGGVDRWKLEPKEMGDLLCRVLSREPELVPREHLEAVSLSGLANDERASVVAAAWFLHGSASVGEPMHDALLILHQEHPKVAVEAWKGAAVRNRHETFEIVARLGPSMVESALKVLFEHVPRSEGWDGSGAHFLSVEDFLEDIRSRMVRELADAGHVLRVRRVVDTLPEAQREFFLDLARDASARRGGLDLSVEDVLGLSGGGVFISYRRKDNEKGGLARSLYERLSRKLGPEVVWMDVPRIEGGEDFRRAIESGIRSARVMLVVIGDAWSSGLDDEGDFVRREVADAIELDLKVMPVLLGERSMPDADDLPEEMRPLLDYNAMRLSHHDSFEGECELITERVRAMLRSQG